MARIFVTGSADGLGQMAARRMVEDGHRVVLHARNDKRAKEALAAVPGAETAIAGDLSSIAECKQIAEEVNALGAFDAVIHNAGVYLQPRRIATVDGLPQVFAVNTLAPYILTALIRKPKRLVYIDLRIASERRPEPERPDLERAQVEQLERVRRLQAVRRDAGVRRRAQVAGRSFQRSRSRLGADQDGRPERDG